MTRAPLPARPVFARALLSGAVLACIAAAATAQEGAADAALPPAVALPGAIAPMAMTPPAEAAGDAAAAAPGAESGAAPAVAAPAVAGPAAAGPAAAPAAQRLAAADPAAVAPAAPAAAGAGVPRLMGLSAAELERRGELRTEAPEAREAESGAAPAAAPEAGAAPAAPAPTGLAGLGARADALIASARAALDRAAGAGHGAGAEGGHGALSPIGMFMAADIVVKAVMVILAVLSVLGWGVWMARLTALTLGKRRLRRAYRRLADARTLSEALPDARRRADPLSRMIRAAAAEVTRCDAPGFPAEGVKSRAAAHLSRIEAAAARRMQGGTGILAAIASAGPFIGLFGTVWGIMNSFIGIAGSGTTNLAVVAPGIAEALLATALGLVAAIPATLFHTQLARGAGAYRLMLGDAAELTERTLSRDLDRPAPTPAPVPARPLPEAA
ncbi:tonB-system energizer ExbB [Rhodovulum sp. DZ06]|uniref:tonB-system energizer ExbB n=1 Tax=Rhodovulum sp. DZ06 TaxID=3425126 RepID=UPI003D32D698